MAQASHNTEQRESQRDTHFPRHPNHHVSTGSTQPHSGTALLQHTAPLQPKHSHRVDAFTQNRHTASLQAYGRDPAPLINVTQMHGRSVSWPHSRPGPPPQAFLTSTGQPTGDQRRSGRCSSHGHRSSSSSRRDGEMREHLADMMRFLATVDVQDVD